MQRLLQILNEACGRELLVAASASLHSGSFASTPVKFDANGGGSLDNMEELAEGQRDEPQHNHRFMGQRDKPVVGTTEKRAIGGQSQTRHDNSHEQCQGNNIEAPTLHSDKRKIMKTTMKGHDQPDEQ